MTGTAVKSSAPQQKTMEGYYRFHAGIYDLTRWCFLFGRRDIISIAAEINRTPSKILEIGCGTGKNLQKLRRAFPEAEITGLDVSASMLKVAEKKLGTSANNIRLIHTAYERPLSEEKAFDLILFSYCLSMINPGYDTVVKSAREDLAENGIIAVVDFENSVSELFKRWMKVNHVRMDSQILPELKSGFTPLHMDIRDAYRFLWKYFLFAGKKNS